MIRLRILAVIVVVIVGAALCHAEVPEARRDKSPPPTHFTAVSVPDGNYGYVQSTDSDQTVYPTIGAVDATSTTLRIATGSREFVTSATLATGLTTVTSVLITHKIASLTTQPLHLTANISGANVNLYSWDISTTTQTAPAASTTTTTAYFAVFGQ